MNTEVDEYFIHAEKATLDFSKYTQIEVDKIVEAVHLVGLENRVKLAKMAADETGIGKWEDKVTKNILSTKYIYEDIKDLKTVGIISDNDGSGIIEIAQPIGPILAIVPSTNPTSTVMFKILIALKTRNPIIISLPRLAQNVCAYTAELLYKAALTAGAPKNCIQWIPNPSREKTQAFMSDQHLSLILATGGEGLVNAAYSSGTPALGVGPGNVPVFIDNTVDMNFAIEQIMMSKTFDNGTICASEQAIIVQKENMQKALTALKQHQAYMVPVCEMKALEEIVYDKKKEMMAGNIVGKSANYIAKKAQLNVPEHVSLLVVKQTEVGKDYPFSSEILAPVIALYEANDFQHTLEICSQLNQHGGKGHTASIFSNDEDKILEYSMKLNAGRIIVNSPSAQGAVGGLYNNLSPSLTLGCGSGGKNSTTDNITAKHLLNIQRIAKPISKLVDKPIDELVTKSIVKKIA